MKSDPKDVLGRAIAEDGKLKLKVKRLSDDAILPTKATEDSAGFDVYTMEEIFIPPQMAKKIHLGIAIEIPKGYVGLIFARSGLASKKNLRPSNCVGVVDADYRGEVMVSLYNDSANAEQYIDAGERIAQLAIIPYVSPEIVECDELSDTARGEGGFGSTGTK